MACRTWHPRHPPRDSIWLRLQDLTVPVNPEALLEVFPAITDHVPATRHGIDFGPVLTQSKLTQSGRVKQEEHEFACQILLRALTYPSSNAASFSLSLSQELDQRVADCFPRQRDLRTYSLQVSHVVLCLAELSTLLDSAPLATVIHSVVLRNKAAIMACEKECNLGVWVSAVQLARMSDVQLSTCFRELVMQKPDLARVVRRQFRPQRQFECDAVQNIVAMTRFLEESGEIERKRWQDVRCCCCGGGARCQVSCGTEARSYTEVRGSCLCRFQCSAQISKEKYRSDRGNCRPSCGKSLFCRSRGKDACEKRHKVNQRFRQDIDHIKLNVNDLKGRVEEVESVCRKYNCGSPSLSGLEVHYEDEESWSSD